MHVPPRAAAGNAATGLRPRVGYGLALAVLCLAQAVFYARFLLYPDLHWSYPFPGPDGGDWIANGLALAGEPVRYTLRPPLLPLILAGLHRLGALRLYPLLGQGIFHGGLLVLYRICRRGASPRASFAACLVVLFDFSLQLAALEVMADLLATALLVGAALAFLAAGERPRLYALAGLLGGLSAVTQLAALVLPLSALAVLLAFRRSHLRRPALAAGAALFAVFPLGWSLVKLAAYGPHADVLTRHWSLLALRLGSVGFYTSAALSTLGWPALVLMAWGGAQAARRARWDEAGAFLLLLVGSLAGFFVFCYGWEAKRFLYFALVPAAFFVARSLARLEGGRLFWPAVAAAVVGAAWPLPGPDAAETRFLLWPAPALYADPGGTPGERAAGQSLHLVRAPLAELPGKTAYGRVLRRWRQGPGPPPPDPALFVACRSVVYLGADDLPAARRYGIQYHLGNALRKRVKVVPQSLYPARWWGFRGLSHVVDAGPYSLFTLPLPPGGESVLALRRGDPRIVRLRRRAPVRAPPPPTATLARAVRIAGGLDAEVEGPDGFLVVLAAGDWVRMLPFAVRTSSLFLPAPDERSTWAARFAGGPWLERFEVEGLPVGRRVFDARRTVVVLPQGEAPGRQRGR